MNQIEFEDKCRGYLSNYVPDMSKCFVAGGFFARHYHDFPIRDIDMYVDNLDVFNQFVKEFKNMSNFTILQEKKKFCKLINNDTKVGVDIIAFHQGSNKFTKGFDFTISQGFFQHDQFQSHDERTFPDIILKRLRFTGRSFAVNNENNLLTRAKKYLDLGFEISTEDMNSMYHFLMSPKAREITLEGYSDKDKDAECDVTQNTAPVAPWKRFLRTLGVGT